MKNPIRNSPRASGRQEKAVPLGSIRTSVANAWLYLAGPKEVDGGRFSKAVCAAHDAGLIGRFVFDELSDHFDPRTLRTSLALAQAIVAINLTRPMRVKPLSAAANAFGRELRMSIPRRLSRDAESEMGHRLPDREVEEPDPSRVRSAGREQEAITLAMIRNGLIRAWAKFYVEWAAFHDPTEVDRDRLSKAAAAAHEAGIIGDVVFDALTEGFQPRSTRASLALAIALANAQLTRPVEDEEAHSAAAAFGRELRASIPGWLHHKARSAMYDHLFGGGE